MIERCGYCDDTGDVIDFSGEWRGFCHCFYGMRAKMAPCSRIDQFEVLWFYTEVELKAIMERFAPIHARFKKKEGYSVEDQAELDVLRSQCTVLGDHRYHLLKEFADVKRS